MDWPITFGVGARDARGAPLEDQDPAGVLRRAHVLARQAHDDLAVAVADPRAPLPEGGDAFLVFERIRGSLDGGVDTGDLAALDRLVDGGPEDVRHRDDLVVRSRRARTWMARPAPGRHEGVKA
ncbi:hypothetical protein SBADM41S_01412 [Streptomyces badius]